MNELIFPRNFRQYSDFCRMIYIEKVGTVGASISVTRRVLSENVDVIYDKSLMF